jgi:hypothetical protein
MEPVITFLVTSCSYVSTKMVKYNHLFCTCIICPYYWLSILHFYKGFSTLGPVFMPPRRRVGGHINLPLSVRLDRYMVCSAISSYSFGATALIFCRMFIHIMEVCMSTGFWFSSNILKMTGSWTSCIKGTWFVRLTHPTVLELQL